MFFDKFCFVGVKILKAHKMGRKGAVISGKEDSIFQVNFTNFLKTLNNNSKINSR